MIDVKHRPVDLIHIRKATSTNPSISAEIERCNTLVLWIKSLEERLSRAQLLAEDLDATLSGYRDDDE